ncbi:unnamed protein product [Ambrosiozyma monospora]|uniref:Unnamed protein product n=1 Tax=Ambrosiozyma monospora TaxID=43982 RepID=A0ACB5SVT6_AMBMO|nr:unnamed protein product [Ambrosiozyma monospora]
MLQRLRISLSKQSTYNPPSFDNDKSTISAEPDKDNETPIQPNTQEILSPSQRGSGSIAPNSSNLTTKTVVNPTNHVKQPGEPLEMFHDIFDVLKDVHGKHKDSNFPTDPKHTPNSSHEVLTSTETPSKYGASQLQAANPDFSTIESKTEPAYEKTQTSLFSDSLKSDDPTKITTNEDNDVVTNEQKQSSNILNNTDLESDIFKDLYQGISSMPQQSKPSTTNDTSNIWELPHETNNGDDLSTGFFWETDDFSGTKETSMKDSKDDPLEFELPWEPSEAEEENALILGPFKKKYSPIDETRFINNSGISSTPGVGNGIGNTVHGNTRNSIGSLVGMVGSTGLETNSMDNFNVVDFERDFKSLMEFKRDVKEDDVFQNIDLLRPEYNTISLKRYKELVSSLKKFNLKMLRDYVFVRGDGSKGVKSAKKAKVINVIVDHIWGIKASDEADVPETMTKITLQNKRERFLLFSHGGHLMRSWSSQGARLSFNNFNSELIVRGSPMVVQFVQTSWNLLMNKVQSTMVNLSEILTFYDKLQRKPPIELLQMRSNVFFDEVEPNEHIYMLSSFSHANLQLAKSALFSATEYSATLDRALNTDLITSKDSKKLVFKQYMDPSLPWYLTGDAQSLYRVKTVGNRLFSSPDLGEEEEVNPGTLFEEVKSLRAGFDNAAQRFELNFMDLPDEDTHIADKIFKKSEQSEENIAKIEVEIGDDKDKDKPIKGDLKTASVTGLDVYQTFEDLNVEKVTSQLQGLHSFMTTFQKSPRNLLI